MSANETKAIVVRNLDCGYKQMSVLRGLNFEVCEGEIFVIMGESGCGKSTLLKHLIGLNPPSAGEVVFLGRDFSHARGPARHELQKCFGVLYQSGALWSSLTVAENVALPLIEHTALDKNLIAEMVMLKLALVRMDGYAHLFPSELSGGMKKRAGLARAMALDPKILFFDEPSAGLDPPTARELDDLIKQMRDTLGTTVVVVTHELASIFAIADNAMMLSKESLGIVEIGRPAEMAKHSPHEEVRQFLNRLPRVHSGATTIYVKN
ncbi:MAG TPA: ATP-binding cassette domain-containing protein [Candidatus Cybelea sp.]|jgi:phospholipid/cholesterol/gamma-HCH transport system ATP-binding protein|nr:ATP-binding cassette domain-containing protein [Candidatus Cybelea sp.]